jgi:hypothetical protein
MHRRSALPIVLSVSVEGHYAKDHHLPAGRIGVVAACDTIFQKFLMQVGLDCGSLLMPSDENNIFTRFEK